MKKLILAFSMFITTLTVLAKTNPSGQSVKLGQLNNGVISLTYDATVLKNALSIIVAEDNQEVVETSIFLEGGKYYLWGAVADKNSKELTGKLVFSLELDKDNNFLLAAIPVYGTRCVSVNGSCNVCAVEASTCYCSAAPTPSGGQCAWRKVVIGDTGTSILFNNTFNELVKNSK